MPGVCRFVTHGNCQAGEDWLEQAVGVACNEWRVLGHLEAPLQGDQNGNDVNESPDFPENCGHQYNFSCLPFSSGQFVVKSLENWIPENRPWLVALSQAKDDRMNDLILDGVVVPEPVQV